LMKLSLWAQNNECDLTIFNMNWFSRALLKFYRVADLLAKNIAASDDRPAHQALQLAS
jgi:hypothetical protein